MKIQYRVDKRGLIVGALVILLGCGGLVLTNPQPAGESSLYIDASGSTGSDYVNKYIPSVSSALPLLVGKRVYLARVGGRNEVLFDNRITSEDVKDLQTMLVSSKPFPSDVKGSPITAQSLSSLNWFQGGGRRVVVIWTDGLEDDVKDQKVNLKKGSARGVTALILFPRVNNPLVAEAWRAAGAEVEVLHSSEEAEAVLSRCLTGTTSMLQAAHQACWWILIVGLITVLCSMITLEERKAKPVEELPEVQPEILRPSRVVLTAQVNDDPRLKARKTMVCGNGGMVVAREGSHGADLVVPVRMLGPAAEMALSIHPIDVRRVEVRNRGRVPIVAGSRSLSPEESAEVPGTSRLRLAPRVNLNLQMNIAEEL